MESRKGTGRRALPAAAASLNAATDQLNKSIAELDGVLKKFSLGVPTWVPFYSSPESDYPHFYHDDIGYAKIGGKWGVAIRTVDGDDVSVGPDDLEQWLFNDAPRLLRVRAIEKIPELLEALLNSAAEMTKEIIEKAEEVGALTVGIDAVINGSQKRETVGEIMQDLRTGLANDQPRKRTTSIGAMMTELSHPTTKRPSKP